MLSRPNALLLILALSLGAWTLLPAHPHTDELERIAELMELQPGMQIADVGAGDGEFAEELARRVGPTGHMSINEIDDGELNKIRRLLKRTDLENISLVEGRIDDTMLPASVAMRS